MSGMRLLDYWSPPEGAGQPVACLATSFTFEADFFAQECLSRFLSLSTAYDEGDRISSIAALLEEEDRLSEAQITVLVDRRTPAEKRNLRWDVLPVAVPGGLLHSKVSVLLWERATRIVIGSANLTTAGYRRQIELALAVDLTDGCQVPRPVLDDIVSELRHYVQMAPGDLSGPKARALFTVERLEARVAAMTLPLQSRTDLRIAAAPSRPGSSPLDRLSGAWRGSQPLRAALLSPYWDEDPSPTVEGVRRHLTGRPASSRRTTLIAAVDPVRQVLQAPVALTEQDAEVVVFDPPDEGELRSVHAKLMLLESDDWLAAMVGSSNATVQGLGLNPGRGHHELNLWIGCPARSRTARNLRALARQRAAAEFEGMEWERVPDDESPELPALPMGFLDCVVDVGVPARVRIRFDARHLPSDWTILTPAGAWLASATSWWSDGSPDLVVVALPDDVLPAYLLVTWTDSNGSHQASLAANVLNRAALPSPAELAEVPVFVLLAALASTRPLPVALEHELRRRERQTGDNGSSELDPLRRFDDSRLLLPRVRHISLALWRLRERLSRPTTNLDALEWRLRGMVGPQAIANSLARTAAADGALHGEARFLLAELALTVASVDWSLSARDLDQARVRALVMDVIAHLEARLADLPQVEDDALQRYVDDAFREARRWR